MPVLPITDGEGRFFQFAGEIVYGVMHYPRDEAQRAKLLAMNVAERAAGGRRVEVPGDLLKTILDAPSRPEMEKELSQIAESAMISSQVLQWVAMLSNHQPQHASVLKAVEIVCYQAERYNLEHSAVASSPAFIKKQWSHFKPVAHLWCAAWAFLRQAPKFTLIGIQAEALLDFLGTAEWFRKEGERIVARGQAKTHGPVLNPSETWIPPPDIQVSEMEAELGPPATEILEVLRKYRAPKKLHGR